MVLFPSEVERAKLANGFSCNLLKILIAPLHSTTKPWAQSKQAQGGKYGVSVRQIGLGF